jgi:hypothetical protein
MHLSSPPFYFISFVHVFPLETHPQITSDYKSNFQTYTQQEA